MINFDKTKETHFLFCVNKKIRKNLQTKKPPQQGVGLNTGCFTWIRTKINGVRVRCPTVRR